jgi:phosphotriesterase-related protein
MKGFEVVQNQNMTGMVMTVTGPIHPDKLGSTLMHEHLFFHSAGRQTYTPDKNTPATEGDQWYEKLTLENLHLARHQKLSLADNMSLTDEQVAAAEVLYYMSRGGSTIVDVTSLGIRRDPLALARLSVTTGLNVVMGSSWYSKMTHPQDMDDRSVEDLLGKIVRDINVGVDDTGVRSGIIGEVGINGNPLTPNEIKVIRASARASRASGAAISLHWGGVGREKFEVARVIVEEGGDLTRTIFGHSDLIAGDLDLMLELLELGVYIQFDLLGRVVVPLMWAPLDPQNPWPDYLSISGTALVADAIPKLIDAGYVDRILLSQDVCTKVQLKAYGGTGYSFILDIFLPHLTRVGVSAEHLSRMMIDNPRRVLMLAEPGK